MPAPAIGPLFIYILPSSINVNSISITVDGSSDTFNSSISGEYLLLETHNDYNWNDTHTIGVSCDGYLTASGTTNTDGKVYITLQQIIYVSKLSNGTTTYALKDANAYHQGDLATVATSGSYDDLSDQPSFNGITLDNTTSTSYYGESTTAAATVQKEVSIPSITKLEVGQVIIVKPTITSTVANSTLKLNNFDAYPMRYGSAAITTSTDSIVWYAEVPSTFVFDGTYWRFVSRGGDNNTTYTMNYTVDAGNYKAGTGAYAISRYSLILQKPDGTWEKLTNPAAAYSTAKTKTVNTTGFLLNRIKYYGATANVANGALVATNVCYDKAASVDLRYSTNCGATTTWAAGEFIYLVGSINSTDGLFYLDTTQWWTNALPTTNDGKLYIRLGIVLTAASYTMSFLNDRPIYYYNGTKICEYFGADNKQDLLVSGTTIKTINNQSVLGSGNLTIDSLPAQSGNANKFLTTDGSSASWANLATVATSGSYSDLSNKPTINDLTTTTQQNALNSGITTALVTQIGTNQTNITTINNKIPSAATSSNQLADKAFVNSSINAVAAYYITADATGNAFATKAALDAGPYYHDGTARTPTENDYAIVSADETHGNACTRYSYTGSQWSFQYIVNDTPFTQAQINAINSGITSTLVSNYSTHIADTTIHVTSSDKTTWNGKQAAITGAATTITSSNLTASRALISNSSGKVAVSDVTSTELGYLDGVTSAIQTQLDNKVDKTTSNTKIYATTNAGAQTTLDYSIGNEGATIAQRTSAGQLAVAQTPTENTHAASKKYVDDGLSGKEATITGAATTITSNDLTAEYALVSDSNGKVAVSSVTAAELGYVSGVTSAIQTQLNNKQATLVSGTNIKSVNGTTLLGSGDLSTYPTQTGNSGKYLTTNGTSVSWANVDSLPSQSGNSGKFLTTNGTTASWANIPTEIPSQSGNSGKYLTTNGSVVSWATVVDALPSQTGNSGKFLTTNGSAASWASLATVATSGSYNDLTNKLTAGTDITISSNQISCTYPEVYITEEDYQDLVDAGTVDPNTYYNTDDATQMTVTDFITKKDSMNPGDQLPQGYLVFVEVQ